MSYEPGSPLRVVGFCCQAGPRLEIPTSCDESDLSSSPCTKQKLPESPLGRLLRTERPHGLPKLTLKSLGKPGSSSAAALGLNINRRSFSAAAGEVPAPVTPGCSRLSSSSEPIPIPEYCRPFRPESQPDAPLSGGWAGSSSPLYFACGKPGRVASAELPEQPGSRPLSSVRLQIRREAAAAAAYEPLTPCCPDPLPRQRSLLGLEASSTAAPRTASSAASATNHVIDQHFSHLEAQVARQSKSIWELQGKLHEVKRQRDALLLQLEGRPEKTMRSCEEVDESEILLASDADLSCWQQHELHAAERGPSHEALLFGH